MDLTSVGYRVKQSRVGKLLDTLKLTDASRELFRSIEYALAGGVLEISGSGYYVQYPVDSIDEFGILRHLAVTERPVLKDFAAELRASDTVYDIGAHLGLYTILAEQIVTTGDVVAFELAQVNANRLTEMSSGATKIVDQAVSDETGVEYDSRTDVAPGDVTASVEKVLDTEGTAKTITIDAFAAEHRQPNVVKIDVEGHEEAVLTGGARTFADERCRVIYVETHDTASHEESRDQLAEFGFDSVRTIHTRENQQFLKATR